MLEACSHVAVLQPAIPEGAAALRRHALPLPAGGSSWDSGALRPGQPIAALGAPFGSLAPGTFCGFQAGGVVAAAIPGLGSSSRGGCASGGGSRGVSPPALLLADLRCSPGMEGGPVFETSPAAGRPAAALPPLLGMLLPPLKAPAAAVELALVVPIGAVAEAAHSALGASRLLVDSSSGGSSNAASGQAAAAAGLSAVHASLPAVVAVSAAGSWASGVIVSSGGHMLTNAHALQPALPAQQPGLGDGGGPGAQMELRPASATAGIAHSVRVLLPAEAGPSGRNSDGACWATADVLYAFRGPLDLAVLRLRQPAGQQPAWRPVRLSRQPPAPGQRVCVAGFPVFSPRASPADGPLVTAGTLAKLSWPCASGACWAGLPALCRPAAHAFHPADALHLCRPCACPAAGSPPCC